ncbi:MAG TPA: pimeloyl-ACP methyl ester esterase BioH [Rhodocyclaceae bacterium]|nr:pimeloyl-ACP methyl ester esterase BioH [Rhodocyclaceae bacterium]
MNRKNNLVLLHGWGQHSGIWQQLIAGLTPQFNVDSIDLPGHGYSRWEPPYFALDALVDAIAKQAPAHCHVAGWSLGGMLALRWAQRYPKQVQKLILIASTPCFGQRPGWTHGTPEEIQTAFAEQVAADPTRGLQRFADLLAEGEADVRATRRALRTHLAASPTPPAAALLAGLKFLAETDLRADLLATPPPQATLLLHGEDDTITPFAASQYLASTLPHARLQALPQCGHAPMVSHPAELLTALQNFLHD